MTYHSKNIKNTSIQFSKTWIFSTGFIDFTLKGKSLAGFRNLFSPNNYKDIDKIILN